MRVLERLDRLYAIGGGPGANRLGGTREEDEAHELVAGWMREAGLEVEVDSAGNLFGRLRGRRPELPEVWTGSHLDSVPNGGRFDGALGVVGALEAVERLGQRERTLVVIAFRDEEGCSGPGCRGSQSLRSGGLDRCRRPSSSCTSSRGLGSKGPARRSAWSPGSRPRHEETLVFEGREGHAGTTPMQQRDDALVAAAELVLRLRDAAANVDGAVATVGRLSVEPGASNVIPARVVLSVDVRAPDDERLEQVAAVVPGRALTHPRGGDVTDARAALLEQLATRGLDPVELASGAGHDAGVLAAAGVPTAMLFVRSLNGGISHSPDEHSAPDDVELAVDVLAGALERSPTLWTTSHPLGT